MKKRKIIFLILALLSVLCLGSTYSWSLFVVPLEELFGWQRSNITFAYTLNTSIFAAGGLIAGIWNQKGHHRRCYVLAGVLMASGYFLMTQMHTLTELYIFYSLFTGLANGIGFITVMSCATKMFEKNNGLISGVLSMALGMSSFLLSPSIADVIEGLGVLKSFTVMSCVIGGGLLFCGLTVPLPKKIGSEVNETKAQKSREKSSIREAIADMFRDEQIRTYLIWTILFTAVGLGYISQTAACAADIGAPSHIAAYIVSALSVCSGLGRLSFGRLFDAKPYQFVLRMITVSNFLGTSLITLAIINKSILCLAVGSALVGLGYGGTMVSNTVVPRLFFKPEEYSFNLGIINNTGLPGSFLGHLAVAAMMDLSGTYTVPFLLLVIFSVINLFLTKRFKNAPNNAIIT